MISITQDDPRHHLAWLHKSCDYIRALYHPHEHAHTFNLDELDRGRFYVIHHGLMIGCGAIVPHSHDTMELKHIFIDTTARGLGCGKALLSHIEQMARHDGVKHILLETGNKQPEALGLYMAFGYRKRLAYIAKPLPHAVFMEKII